jgi:putative transposase
VATNNGQTYFVTSNCAERRPLFRHERWANMFLETLFSYRPERYLLHEFTVMPDHFHALITPQETLERAVQCIKGGFSFKAKRAFDWRHDVWSAGFSDHRIRDFGDYEVHRRYIARNAVKARLVEEESAYKFASPSGLYELDAAPQGLKPDSVVGLSGAAEAAPFQSVIGETKTRLERRKA